jgi:hypothetical protein
MPFRHLLRHRKSTSASVISTLKSVCLRVKTTLCLSYRVLEMTLLSALIKSHPKSIKKTLKVSFPTLNKINGVSF